MQGSKKRIEQSVIENCQTQLTEILAGYTDNDIWNADEGPIFSEQIGKYSYQKKKVKGEESTQERKI